MTARNPPVKGDRPPVESRGPEVATALGTIRERARWYDALALGGVQVVLLAVFALPRSVRMDLVLKYVDPTLLTAFTSHFVHLGTAHMLTNLVAYTVVVGLVYLLSLLTDNRVEFYVTFVSFLLVLPLALSALNVALARPRVGFGYSGILMAFVGFLPWMLFASLDQGSDDSLDATHSPALFFFGSALVALLSSPLSLRTAGIAGVAVLAGASFLWCLRYPISDLDHATLGEVRRSIVPGPPELLAGALGVFVLFLIAAFPGTPGGDGSIVNLYSHFLGYAFGYIVPYVTFQLAVPGLDGVAA